tara:strand:+ start:186 stop:590 length:405 start_codon:yes stop_codon:yes gene_type:complete
MKEKSFKFVYWLMLFILAADTIDTIYRFIIIGYLGEGTTFPGVVSIIKPDTTDLVVFIVAQVVIIYGIYLLYKLKKLGGYLFLLSNILFLIYASILGPIAEIGISNILLPILLFFCLYIILAIGIPWLYSEKFE